jgi:hypothetical protein
MVRYCKYLIASHNAFNTLKRGLQVQWFNSPVDDHADAMGCLLMGGEL